MKNKKKGFTLVELIVVLAILAILAAMLVPALTGYIDKANDKKIQSVTRQLVIATQTAVSEAYAKNGSLKDFDRMLNVIVSGNEATFEPETVDGINIGEICDLAEICSDMTKTLNTYTYTNTFDGKTVTFDGYQYTGKLKYGINWIAIQFDKNGKLTNLFMTTKDGANIKYDGITGEYSFN